MIVVDASVLANALADDHGDGHAARTRLRRAGDLTAPDLVDVETMSVLRKRWRGGDLGTRRWAEAVGDLEAIELTRFPTLALARRAFELRSNVTPYDASYVALAERLGCPLVTADRRLARAPGIRCEVEVLAT